MGDTFGPLSCCVRFRQETEGGNLRNKCFCLSGDMFLFSVTPVYLYTERTRDAFIVITVRFRFKHSVDNHTCVSVLYS